MAAGTFIVFNKFLENMGTSIHNFDSFTNGIKIGLIDTGTPAKTDTDPRWAVGGTPDHSANEATPGGNYSTGGPDLTAVIADADVWTITTDTTKFDLDDVSINSDPSNPSGVTYGIIYDDDATNKNAIGYIEIDTGGADLKAGNFTVTWHTSGLFTVNNPA